MLLCSAIYAALHNIAALKYAGFEMPDQPNLDPLSLWREMLGQWERGMKSLADHAPGSDEFSRAMHQVTSMGLRMQQNVGDMIGKSLTAMNLPTRNDLTAIHERLGRIEARLDGMTAGGPARESATPKPPRPRRPPAA